MSGKQKIEVEDVLSDDETKAVAPPQEKKIKASLWNPNEFHTGTKATLVAKKFDLSENYSRLGEVIQIGCNVIPVSLVRMAGGTIEKKKVTVPVTLLANKRLAIEGGEVFGMTGWYEDQINEYAHRVIITYAPTEEPKKIERYVTPGLWQCTSERHRHSWIITASGEWLGLMNGYVDSSEQPGPDCHPSLIADMNRITNQMPVDPSKPLAPHSPVKMTVYERATCCMPDMSSSLPKDHPDYVAPPPARRRNMATWFMPPGA